MEEEKYFKCISGGTVRGVVEKANDLGLEKEDIVKIFTFNGQVYLIYYK